MAQNDGLRRYIDAALALTQITRSRAEEVVRDLIRTGEVESTRAQDWVEDLVHTSRLRSEAFASTVHTEVRRQLSDLGLRDVNDLARRVAAILDKAGTAARRAGGRATRAAKATRKTAVKKAPAKKAVAKKAVAKKTGAKKTGARRVAGTKKAAGAKKASKKAAARPAPARKSAAKATKKKASGTTAAARRRR